MGAISSARELLHERPHCSLTSTGETELNILGLGTDIIEIARIGSMIERHGELFLYRVYTEEEILYCQKRKNCAQHYAGRWAAKEAVMKALGTGFRKGIGWRDIEVTSQTSGQPMITLRGGTLDFAQSIGVQQMLITISHCRTFATATAIAISEIINEKNA